MKMLAGLVLVAATAVFAPPHARGLGAPAAPPGVSDSDWVPIGEAAGFVIEHGDSLTRRPRIVRGYFTILRGTTWMRVDPNPEMAVRPAALQR
ncbi:MAG TPA: hypothetical protein VHW95_13055 [Steroidobacteraceae bacterium]|jgi:hypothetical protein|nr:hypothetical protein [Steroidobacteraceae bacterium]